MKSRILVIGSLGIDIVLPVKHLPLAGQTLLEENHEILPGGKALVSAMTLAELGIEPILCAAIGDDEEGTRIRNFLKDMGLDSRFLHTVKDEKTAMRVMMIDANGNRHTLRYPSAMGLSRSAIEDGFTCLPDAVLLQGEIDKSLIPLVCELAADQGIPVFFDPGDLLSATDYALATELEIFTPSEEEVRLLTGNLMRTQDEIMRACLQIAARVTARYYVLKLGERGSILFDGTYYKLVTAYEVEKVEDCGVGDIFTAILVAEYLKSGDIRRAMEYANAGAALSVTRRGSITSIPQSEEIAQVVRDNVEAYQ